MHVCMIHACMYAHTIRLNMLSCIRLRPIRHCRRRLLAHLVLRLSSYACVISSSTLLQRHGTGAKPHSCNSFLAAISCRSARLHGSTELIIMATCLSVRCSPESKSGITEPKRTQSDSRAWNHSHTRCSVTVPLKTAPGWHGEPMPETSLRLRAFVACGSNCFGLQSFRDLTCWGLEQRLANLPSVRKFWAFSFLLVGPSMDYACLRGF